MNYVGIDYHKRYSVVCIVNETGSIVAKSASNTLFRNASSNS